MAKECDLDIEEILKEAGHAVVTTTRYPVDAAIEERRAEEDKKHTEDDEGVVIVPGE